MSCFDLFLSPHSQEVGDRKNHVRPFFAESARSVSQERKGNSCYTAPPNRLINFGRGHFMIILLLFYLGRVFVFTEIRKKEARYWGYNRFGRWGFC